MQTVEMHGVCLSLRHVLEVEVCKALAMERDAVRRPVQQYAEQRTKLLRASGQGVAE